MVNSADFLPCRFALKQKKIAENHQRRFLRDFAVFESVYLISQREFQNSVTNYFSHYEMRAIIQHGELEHEQIY